MPERQKGLVMNPKQKELIQIQVDGVTIEGLLELPANAQGIVLFAHGSGSSRHSPRNNYVCLLYTSPSPRDRQKSRMPSSA